MLVYGQYDLQCERNDASNAPNTALQDLTMERKAEHKVTVFTDGSSTTSEVVKTVSTLKHNHGKCTTKFTFANDKFAGEAKGNLVDDDGWKADITAAGEIK